MSGLYLFWKEKMEALAMRPSCRRVKVFGENVRMGSSLAGSPENLSWAKLWMKKLNLVATLPRLDSMSLQVEPERQRACLDWPWYGCGYSQAEPYFYCIRL